MALAIAAVTAVMAVVVVSETDFGDGNNCILGCGTSFTNQGQLLAMQVPACCIPIAAIDRWAKRSLLMVLCGTKKGHRYKGLSVMVSNSSWD